MLDDGLPAGGNRPFGYRYVDGALVVDPVERLVVERIFDSAISTSQRKIAHQLNAEGSRSTRGGLWLQSSVARLLRNELYMGKLRLIDHDELFDGKHEAIVSPELWQRVNRSLARPERRAGGRPLTSKHLLTRGVLRCGRCGEARCPGSAGPARRLSL